MFKSVGQKKKEGGAVFVEEKTAGTGEKGLFGETVAADDDAAEKQSVDVDVTELAQPPDKPQPLLALSPVVLDKPEFETFKSVRSLLPYIDELSLFEKRWGYDKGAARREEWCAWAKQEVVPVFNNLLNFCEEQEIFDLKASFVYVEALKKDKILQLYKSDSQTPFYTYEFVREKNGKCLTDVFCDEEEGVKDTVALLLVTTGKKVQQTADKWNLTGRSADYVYLDSLAYEAVDAVARFISDKINKHGACVGNLVPLTDKKTLPARMRPLLDALQAEKIETFYNKADILVPKYAKIYLVCPR